MTEVSRRLRAKFPDTRAEVIDATVAELHREFDGDPIRDFVPVLVERQAVERLASTSRHEGRRARV
jgi:hypothetical protein